MSLNFFKEIQLAKNEYKNPITFVRKGFGIITDSIFFTVFAVLLLLLSIAMIVIGVQRNYCILQPWIQKWLIVFGAVSLFGLLIRIITNFMKMG